MDWFFREKTVHFSLFAAACGGDQKTPRRLGLARPTGSPPVHDPVKKIVPIGTDGAALI
jgi:hypothetical protein